MARPGTLLFAVAFFALATVWAQGEPVDRDPAGTETDAEADEADLSPEERAAMERRLEEERTRLIDMAIRERSVIRTLNRLDGRVRRYTIELNSLVAQEGELARVIADNQRQFEETVEEMQQAREHAEDRLAALYRIYRGSGLQYLFSAESTMDFARRYRAALHILRDDVASVDHYRSRIAIVEAKHQALLERQQEIRELSRRARQKRLEALQARRQHRSILGTIQEDSRLHGIHVREMEDSATRMDGHIEQLDAIGGGAAAGPLDFAEIKGYLDVPVSGKLVDTFGRKVHQKFKTVTFNRGIDIQAQEGTPIRAVYDGKVQIVQFFLGYGRVIIIDHGQRFHTLYANVADPEVKAGQLVRRGETIAFLGHSAVREDPVLHFEIRFQGKAQNPTEWLFLNQDR